MPTPRRAPDQPSLRRKKRSVATVVSATAIRSVLMNPYSRSVGASAKYRAPAPAMRNSAHAVTSARADRASTFTQKKDVLEPLTHAAPRRKYIVTGGYSSQGSLLSHAFR